MPQSCVQTLCHITDTEDDEDETPARKRRLVERAAEGEDDKVNIRICSNKDTLKPMLLQVY